jgi:hypothetical protein
MDLAAGDGGLTASGTESHGQNTWCTTWVDCDSFTGVMDPADSIPDDIDALRAELVAERTA